ncbi:glycosyltransferase, partial [Streptococcus pneumoniae]
EVMAAGIPFISSDVGIVNYLSGGITACSDQEFIRAIEEFASCPEIRNQYGKKGQMEAKEHYQVDDKVKELEALLQKVVKEEKE